jgi:parallel beta-helix repeat protein
MRIGIHIVCQLAFSVMFTTVLCLGSVWSPRVANATEYYVATAGDDANPGTESRPLSTINKGVSVLQPGDTLYIREGTYAVIDTTMPIPSGTSWSNPVTISGYSGETVTLQGGVTLNTGSTISYVIFDNLVLVNGLYVGCGSHHIRLSNSEVKNGGNGVQFCENANYNEVINCSVHDAAGHGLYITSSNNLFDGNRVYNNGWAGYHLYHQDGHTANNNVVRNSEVYKNGSGRANSGIVVASGSNNDVHGNIVRDNTAGIGVAYGSDNAHIYNNTVYGNILGGIDVCCGVTNTIVENNIVYGNGWGVIDWGSINTVRSNNTEQ